LRFNFKAKLYLYDKIDSKILSYKASREVLLQ